MELRHLRYFVAVAEMENVSRAALKLHVSQPALSRQVRDLEDELGFPLLERSAKSVRLTEAGRIFLGEARAVLQRADDAVKNARRIATAGEELHVAYAPTLTPRLLPGALRGLQAAMPNVRVKLHDLTSEEMLAGLRQGKLHLALTVRPPKAALRGFSFQELAREPLRLAVGAGHALARRRSVTLEEAGRQPFIAYNRAEYPDYHELLEELFLGSKLKPPRIVEEHDGVSSLISGLEACTAVAIVPDSMSCIAGSRLKLLPLVPEPKALEVGVILPKEKTNPTANKFVEMLQSVSGVKP